MGRTGSMSFGRDREIAAKWLLWMDLDCHKDRLVFGQLGQRTV